MLAKERKIYILSRLNSQPAVLISDLCRELNVSRSTVQRDLAYLEKKGQIIRERGGAVKVGIEEIISDLTERPVLEKLNVNLEAKKSIGREAAKEIVDGDLVFMDAGTTALQIIPYLYNKKIKIVTYSYLLLSKLKNLDIDVYMLGGKYNQKHEICYGATTIDNLNEFRFDKAIITAIGVDLQLKEAYTSEVDVGGIKKVAMSRSQRNILLLDDSKFNVTGLCKFANLDEFDAIYVNNKPKEAKKLKNIIMTEGKQ